jgi:hypothetical protein
MPNRLEHEFPYVDMRVLPPIDPSDPSGEIRRQARYLRAKAQRDVMVAAWRGLVALAQWLVRRVGGRQGAAASCEGFRTAPARCQG